MSASLHQVQAIVGDHLAEISKLFRPGAKVTLLVRNDVGADKDADFVLTNDRLSSAITALQKREAAA